MELSFLEKLQPGPCFMGMRFFLVLRRGISLMPGFRYASLLENPEDLQNIQDYLNTETTSTKFRKQSIYFPYSNYSSKIMFLESRT